MVKFLPVSLLLMVLLSACQVMHSAAERGDAGTPALTGATWHWQGSFYNNDARQEPDTPGNYTLRFDGDGKVRLRADCNRAGGRYRLDGHRLTIEVLQTTLAACPPGSLESAYLKDLGNVNSYLFHQGDLILELKYDSGGMRFSAAE